MSSLSEKPDDIDVVDPHDLSYDSISSDILADFSKVVEIATNDSSLSINASSVASTVEGLTALQNSNYNPLATRGLVTNRPELLAVFDYLSVADNNPNRDQQIAEEFLDVQHSARGLLHDNIKSLISTLSADTTASSELDKIETTVNGVIDDALILSQFLNSAIQQLQNARDSLDPVISEAKIKSIVSSIQAGRDDDGIKFGDLASLMSIRGYHHSNISKFSGTKILATLIGDLALLLTDDQRFSAATRDADVSPTDLVFTKDDAFSTFQIDQLATLSPVTSKNDLSTITASFPTGHTDRIKLLVAALSRELRISASIALPNTQAAIKSQIGSMPSTATLVGDVIGVPQNSIVKLPPAGNSALRRLYVDDSRGFVVLPFETRPIKSGTQIFTAGSEYYVDSVVQGRVPFKTDAFVDAMSLVVKRFSSINDIVRRLMLYDAMSHLVAVKIFDAIAESISTAASGVSESGSIIQKSALSIAIFKAAQQNSKIKSLIIKLLNLTVAGMLEEDTPKLSLGSLTPERTSSAFDTSKIVLSTKMSKLINDISIDMSSGLSIKTGFNNSGGSAGSTKHISAITIDNDSLKAKIAQELEKEIISAYSGPNASKISNTTVRTASTGRLSLNSGFSGIFESTTITSNTIASLLVERSAVLNLFDAAADMVVNLINLTDEAAMGYGFTDNDVTKFSGLSTSNLVYLVFEIFSSMSSNFLACDFADSANALKTKINVLPSKNKNFITTVATNLLDLVEITPGMMTGGSINTDSINVTKSPVFTDEIDMIRTNIDNFDDSIVAILDHINAIAQNAANSAETLKTFFSTKTGSTNATTLATISAQFDATLVPALFTKEQIALTLASIDSIKTSGFSILESPTFDAHLVDRSSIAIIKSMCAKKRIFGTNDAATKIISVGIPAGMTRTLPGAFIVGQNVNMHLPKENDVIRIRVCRKNYEFEDIVYKSKDFIFDISKFVRPGQFNDTIKNGIDFDAAINTSLQYIDCGEGTVIVSTGNDIMSSTAYDFLTSDELKTMVSNHAISHVLSMYIRLIAGFDISERSFKIGDAKLSSDDSTIITSSIKILQQLLLLSGAQTTTTGTTLELLRASSPETDEFITNVLEFADTHGVTLDTSSTLTTTTTTGLSTGLTSDALTFAKIFGGASFISGFNSLSTLLMCPAAFERVLHIPINLDDFEIDMAATAASPQGKALIKSQRFQQLQKTVKNTTKIPTTIRFDDIFVVIEPAFKA